MELVRMDNGKVEYVNSLNYALELVEKTGGRELAECISTLYKEQEDEDPCVYTEEEMQEAIEEAREEAGEYSSDKIEWYQDTIKNIISMVEDLEYYVQDSKRINKKTLLNKIDEITRVNTDY